MSGFEILYGLGGTMDDVVEFTRDSTLAIRKTSEWCGRSVSELPGLVDRGMPGTEGIDVLGLNGLISARVLALWAKHSQPD